MRCVLYPCQESPLVSGIYTWSACLICVVTALSLLLSLRLKSHRRIEGGSILHPLTGWIGIGKVQLCIVSFQFWLTFQLRNHKIALRLVLFHRLLCLVLRSRLRLGSLQVCKCTRYPWLEHVDMRLWGQVGPFHTDDRQWWREKFWVEVGLRQGLWCRCMYPHVVYFHWLPPYSLHSYLFWYRKGDVLEARSSWSPVWSFLVAVWARFQILRFHLSLCLLRETTVSVHYCLPFCSLLAWIVFHVEV